MAIFGFTKQAFWLLIPAAGYAIGWKLDRLETERMIMFRDRSGLYGRQTMPAMPSWP
jgi:hypothetical protein